MSSVIRLLRPIEPASLAGEAGTIEGESSHRFLIVTQPNNPSPVVLRQSGDSSRDHD